MSARANACPSRAPKLSGGFASRPPSMPDAVLKENYLRLRLSPDVTIAMGMMTLAPGDDVGRRGQRNGRVQRSSRR